MTLDYVIDFLILVFLECILSIDNALFIGISLEDIPGRFKTIMRLAAIGVATISRILFLFGITWLKRLDTPLFFVLSHPFSISSIMLMIGGLYLAVFSINKLLKYVSPQRASSKSDESNAAKKPSLLKRLIFIFFIDIFFSIDSVFTAIGVADNIYVMSAAIIVGALILFVVVQPVYDFINKRPAIKILSFSFLVLVAASLMTKSFGLEIPSNVLALIMVFTGAVQYLTLQYRKNCRPN